MDPWLPLKTLLTVPHVLLVGADSSDRSGADITSCGSFSSGCMDANSTSMLYSPLEGTSVITATTVKKLDLKFLCRDQIRQLIVKKGRHQ